MEKNQFLLDVSAKSFALLLRAYPLNHRLAFSADMRQTFNDLSRETYKTHGPAGLIALWLNTVFDVLKTALEAHLMENTHMTKHKFVRLSGWGMILAAISLLLTFLSNSQFQAVVDVFLSAPTTASGSERYDSIYIGVRSLPFFFTILLTTVGMIGMHTQYGERSGQPARIALRIGILGGLAAWVYSLGTVVGIGNLRPAMNSWMAIMFAGLFVFGLAAVKEKPMARGNGLPALAGLWWPLIFLGSSVYFRVTGQGLHVPLGLSVAIFSTMSCFLAMLGFVMQADASTSAGQPVISQ